MRWYAAHAYTPNEAPIYGGGCHAVAIEELHLGRLHRKPGDVLCRPSRRFWGLHDTDKGREVTCKGCRAILARAGESFISREDRRPLPTVETSAEPFTPEGRDPTLTLEECLAKLFGPPGIGKQW